MQRCKVLRRCCWALDDLFIAPTHDDVRCYIRRMPKRPAPSASTTFTLGRAAFDRISAVEGLRRDVASEAMFADFDRRNLGAEERRRAIRARHGVEVVAQANDTRVREAAPASAPRRHRTAG